MWLRPYFLLPGPEHSGFPYCSGHRHMKTDGSKVRLSCLDLTPPHHKKRGRRRSKGEEERKNITVCNSRLKVTPSNRCLSPRSSASPILHVLLSCEQGSIYSDLPFILLTLADATERLLLQDIFLAISLVGGSMIQATIQIVSSLLDGFHKAERKRQRGRSQSEELWAKLARITKLVVYKCCG